MIMLSNKIQKSGKMVQLGRGSPCECGDPSTMPRICAFSGQCTHAISVLKRQRQEDASQQNQMSKLRFSERIRTI